MAFAQIYICPEHGEVDGVSMEDIDTERDKIYEWVGCAKCHDEVWNVSTINVIECVLTIAHLDHTPENCADDNLRALCQYDHLKYDRDQHRINAARTRHARNGDLELPLYG